MFSVGDKVEMVDFDSMGVKILGELTVRFTSLSTGVYTCEVRPDQPYLQRNSDGTQYEHSSKTTWLWGIGERNLREWCTSDGLDNWI